MKKKKWRCTNFSYPCLNSEFYRKTTHRCRRPINEAPNLCGHLILCRIWSEKIDSELAEIRTTVLPSWISLTLEQHDSTSYIEGIVLFFFAPQTLGISLVRTGFLNDLPLWHRWWHEPKTIITSDWRQFPTAKLRLANADTAFIRSMCHFEDCLVLQSGRQTSKELYISCDPANFQIFWILNLYKQTCCYEWFVRNQRSCCRSKAPTASVPHWDPGTKTAFTKLPTLAVDFLKPLTGSATDQKSELDN